MIGKSIRANATTRAVLEQACIDMCADVCMDVFVDVCMDAFVDMCRLLVEHV